MSAIIGPSRTFYQNVPVGGGIASGWKGQFGYKESFGTGIYAYATGPGTCYPMPSIPVAQAFRYWWTVKQWRVQYNLSLLGSPLTYDSGLQPYGVMDGGVNERAFCSNSGDLLAAPTLQDRHCSFCAGSLFSVNGGNANALGGIANSFNSFGDEGYISILGSLYVGYGAGDTGAATNFGLVWDDAKPGNVFMSFGLIVANRSVCTVAGPQYPLSAVTGTFDGVPFSLYAYLSSPYTGAITITTQDT